MIEKAASKVVRSTAVIRAGPMSGSARILGPVIPLDASNVDHVPSLAT